MQAQGNRSIRSDQKAWNRLWQLKGTWLSALRCDAELPDTARPYPTHALDLQSYCAILTLANCKNSQLQGRLATKIFCRS